MKLNWIVFCFLIFKQKVFAQQLLTSGPKAKASSPISEASSLESYVNQVPYRILPSTPDGAALGVPEQVIKSVEPVSGPLEEGASSLWQPTIINFTEEGALNLPPKWRPDVVQNMSEPRPDTIRLSNDSKGSDPNIPLVLIELDDFPQPIIDFINKKQEIVRTMVKQAEEAFGLRDELLEKCSCVPNRCENTFITNSTCGQDLGTPGECEAGYPVGSMYSYDFGSAGMPQPTENPANLTGGLKATNCLFKHMEKAIPRLKELNTTTWAYIGTELGAIWSFPGRLRRRSNETGLEQWNYCLPYDARRRPWYHEGATGPIDIVIVVDISDSMREEVAPGISRWEIVQDSLVQFVDTVTYTDYFNIVFFNFEVTEKSQLSTGLLQGTQDNRDRAKNFILSTNPSGQTNFEAAFMAAFNSIMNGIELSPTNSSNCNKVILFMTDGKDQKATVDQDRTKELLDLVEQRQGELESISGKRAYIFSFSIGELADDAIPRIISCNNNGTWASISSEDDPLTVLNTFVKFAGSARNTTRPYFSEITEDAAGLGDEFSVVIPVFTPTVNQDIPGVLFGVASHDILVKDIEDLAGDLTEQLIKILQERSQICDEYNVSPCQQQVLRGAGRQCVDTKPANATCTRFSDKYYVKSSTHSTYTSARASCQQQGGNLAVPNFDEELAFLAGASAYEGSWIGLSHNGVDWRWDDTTIFQNRDDYWGLGQGRDVDDIMCATIAPTGATKNVYAHVCRDSFTSICEFEELPSQCDGEFLDLDDVEYKPSIPSIQQCTPSEGLDQLTWFETVNPDIDPKDLFCTDFSAPSLAEVTDLICCPRE
eukprot:TRINITY_DN2218_c0_g1_i11.p1 TRINITY_DN2218_c0_g1~~TRINITY_DN2218_c0_g1_i11.p1  ORF type:complete len:862 (-),score=105.42 TRINITY_DN2218_c0_g1_i11:1009-3480(-)